MTARRAVLATGSLTERLPVAGLEAGAVPSGNREPRFAVPIGKGQEPLGVEMMSSDSPHIPAEPAARHAAPALTAGRRVTLKARGLLRRDRGCGAMSIRKRLVVAGRFWTNS